MENKIKICQTKNRKGIVASQLVTIILLLLGFAILMVVFPKLLNEKEVEREVCYESVILRGTIPDITATGSKNLVNLKCQTRKVCLTDKVFGKGDCSEFDNEADKKDYETIRVSKDKTQEDINRFVARELASCWAMMGKGKVQIFTRDAITKKRCSVCSRIAFDSSLKEKLGEVKGLGDYLFTREVPNQGVSYWTYLTEQRTIEDYEEDLDEFSIEQKAIVFMEMDETKFKQMVTDAVAGTIGIMFGVVSPVAKIKVGTIGFMSAVAISEIIGEDKNKIKYRTGWSFIDYKPEVLSDLECSAFASIG